MAMGGDDSSDGDNDGYFDAYDADLNNDGTLPMPETLLPILITVQMGIMTGTRPVPS